MADLYYVTLVTKLNHYKDADNYTRISEETWEIKEVSLEDLQAKLLGLIKTETEPDMFGEYVKYEWSEVYLIQEFERIDVKRRDIPGYAEYLAGKEEQKRKQEARLKEIQQAAQIKQDYKLYKELMEKYPNGIPGAK